MSFPTQSIEQKRQTCAQVCEMYSQGRMKLSACCKKHGLTPIDFHAFCLEDADTDALFRRALRIVQQNHAQQCAERARTRLLRLLNGYKIRETVADEVLDKSGQVIGIKKKTTEKQVMAPMPALVFSLQRLEAILRGEEDETGAADASAARLLLPDNGRTYQPSDLLNEEDEDSPEDE